MPETEQITSFTPRAEDFMQLTMSDPEFVSELVDLIAADNEPLSTELRIAAVRALAVQLQDRSRHTAVIAAINSGGQSGLLCVLIQQSVAALAAAALPASDASVVALGGVAPAAASVDIVMGGDAAAVGGAEGCVEFADALLSLITSLVATSSGCTALAESGAIGALLPIMQVRLL